MTNTHKQVADPDGFNEGTYGLEVSKRVSQLATK